MSDFTLGKAVVLTEDTPSSGFAAVFRSVGSNDSDVPRSAEGVLFKSKLRSPRIDRRNCFLHLNQSVLYHSSYDL